MKFLFYELDFLIETVFAKTTIKAPEKKAIQEQSLSWMFKDGFIQNMNVHKGVCECVFKL